MKFNSFYFLHPHKTAGRYIYKNVLFQIEELLNKYNIKVINKTIDNDMPHFGWHSEIDDQTYILSSFRDPLLQVISLYSSNLFKNKDQLINNINIPNSMFFNNQSKSLCFDSNLEDFAQNCPQPELSLALSRSKRVNRFVDPTYPINNVDLCKTILTDLGIDDNIDITLNLEYFNDNPISKEIYNSLSDSEKRMIIDKSSIDYAVYNSIKNV